MQHYSECVSTSAASSGLTSSPFNNSSNSNVNKLYQTSIMNNIDTNNANLNSNSTSNNSNSSSIGIGSTLGDIQSVANSLSKRFKLDQYNLNNSSQYFAKQHISNASQNPNFKKIYIVNSFSLLFCCCNRL